MKRKKKFKSNWRQQNPRRHKWSRRLQQKDWTWKSNVKFRQWGKQSQKKRQWSTWNQISSSRWTKSESRWWSKLQAWVTRSTFLICQQPRARSLNKPKNLTKIKATLKANPFRDQQQSSQFPTRNRGRFRLKNVHWNNSRRKNSSHLLSKGWNQNQVSRSKPRHSKAERNLNLWTLAWHRRTRGVSH